jgi:hypothetical protein
MSNVNQIGAPKGLSPAKLYSAEVKAQQVKASEAGGNEMAAWLEEAKAWVAQVRSGQAQDDPYIPGWQYEQWISQVEGQIYGGAGGAGGGMPWDVTGGGTPAAATPQAPPGAIVGSNGNYVFDHQSADLIYDGNPTCSEVNSENVRMAVDSMGAKYTFTEVSDGVTGETVLKLVIDGPSGQQTYLLNSCNDPDFQLDIFAANPETITDDPNLQEILGKYNIDVRTLDEINQSDEEQLPQAVFGDSPLVPEEKSKEPPVFFWEATDTVGYIDFYPTSQGEDVPNETHEVEGNSNINLKPSDSAVVTKSDTYDGKEGPGYDYVVTVTHSDGTTDTFMTKAEWITNINGKMEKVSFAGFPEQDPLLTAGQVPEELAGIMQVNGVSGPQECPFVPGPGDSTPANVEGETATYDTMDPVTIHANHDDDVDNHVITSGSTVDINPASPSDTVTVTVPSDPTQCTTVQVKSADGSHTETFYIQPGFTGLNIHGLPANTQVQFGSLPYNPTENMDGLNAALEAHGYGDKIKFPDVEAGAAPTSEDEVNAQAIAQQLADTTGISMTAEEILEAAETHGIDLAHPPTIPTPELLNFLKDINPDIKNAVDAINAGQGDPAYLTNRNLIYDALVLIYGDRATIAKPAGDSAMGADAGYNANLLIFNGSQCALYDKNIGAYVFTPWAPPPEDDDDLPWL